MGIIRNESGQEKIFREKLKQGYKGYKQKIYIYLYNIIIFFCSLICSPAVACVACLVLVSINL